MSKLVTKKLDHAKYQFYQMLYNSPKSFWGLGTHAKCMN